MIEKDHTHIDMIQPILNRLTIVSEDSPVYRVNPSFVQGVYLEALVGSLLQFICLRFRPKMGAFDSPLGKPVELMDFRDILKLMKTRRIALPLMKYTRVTMQDFAAQFKDPFIRKAFPEIYTNPDLSMATPITLPATMHLRSAGYPIGAPWPFQNRLHTAFRI